jgi:hypothetical protein
VPQWHPERKHRKGYHSPETGAPIAVQARNRGTITPAPLKAFSKLMYEKLDTADVQARKAYLRSVMA